MTGLDENSLENSTIVWCKSMGYPVSHSAPGLTWDSEGKSQNTIHKNQIKSKLQITMFKTKQPKSIADERFQYSQSEVLFGI